MSSLNTLLEAARFLELQEQEQQHRANVEAAALAASMGPPSPSSSSTSSSSSSSSTTTTSSSPGAASAVAAEAVAPHPKATPPSPVFAQTVAVISSSSISSSVLATAFPAANATAAPVPQVAKKLDQDGHVTSTTPAAGVPAPRHRILHNSFDIMNPMIVDEANGLGAGNGGGAVCGQGGGGGQGTRRKQPPMVFRAGTREVHNKLEKHRRAHLKECFDILKKQLPTTQDEKKTSNLSILHSALRYIQTLKRKERELEHEMERLAREKISSQQRLAVLKKDIASHYDNVDFSKLLPDVAAAAPSATPTATPATDVAAAPAQQHHHFHPQPPQLHHPHHHHQAVKGEAAAAAAPLQNGEKMIPILAKGNVPVSHGATVKEVPQPAVQTTATALSVLPMTYPVNQGLVLQKVIVPKGIDGLAPLVSTHFIAAPQQINGKVVPLTQYLVKPVVVVSTASPRPS